MQPFSAPPGWMHVRNPRVWGLAIVGLLTLFAGILWAPLVVLGTVAICLAIAAVRWLAPRARNALGKATAHWMRRHPPLESDEQHDEGWPAGLACQLTQWRDPDGRVEWSGQLCVELREGDRLATAHVAFCPPLAHAPQVTCHQLDGPMARLKVALAVAHGVRFEVRLARPAPEALRVVIEFVAQGPAVADSSPQAFPDRNRPAA